MVMLSVRHVTNIYICCTDMQTRTVSKFKTISKGAITKGNNDSVTLKA